MPCSSSFAPFWTRPGLIYDHDAIVAVNATPPPHYAPTAAESTRRSARRHGADRPVGAETTRPLSTATPTSPGWPTAAAEAAGQSAEVFAVVAAGATRRGVDATRAWPRRTPSMATRSTTSAAGSSLARGYGDAFFHRTGHSLGVTTHYNGVNIDNLRDARPAQPDAGRACSPSSRASICPLATLTAAWARGGLGIRSEINCLATQIASK
jgi:Xaa-Pro dipeptidase